ncbi:MobC family plasmid mobilization relaxosome protein [Desulfovibrio cuneatus]|uniref:MobC family plasmid mobilization relaxosome protein n=1 Tax=Desulfovibrio cuneatus TaxID=159728 RepID=UPI00042A1A29|nr:MobC family plasmid mobilization relaxosome protein [Desulfovibrio cuneatus]
MTKPNRTAWLKLRVTSAEKEAIAAKAAAQGQTVTDFIRQRALDYHLRQTPLEREHVRQLARIGANLNQLARWANTFKNRAEVVQVLAALWSMEQSLQNADTRPPQGESREEPPCT